MRELDFEPDRTYCERGLQLRMLGGRVTYESGVYMILTCQCYAGDHHKAGIWRQMLVTGPNGLASYVRAYGGADGFWTRDQALSAWTMKHHRTWDNHWTQIAGREILGSTCTCAGAPGNKTAPT